jgi:UDP-N-acetylglucosamine--N-acetylmuramyl-(pentapeptide) pyrophosphoryl-undecaprenol N-acetylglucosamine transferase
MSDRSPQHAADAVGFAGGGSGGHISPGLAIAERVAARSPQTPCVFLCSTRAVDRDMLAEAGAIAEPIPASPPSLHPRRAMRFLHDLRMARRRAVEVIRHRRIRHIVSLGGFVTVPVLLAARSLAVPVTLLNLDATPGRANRLVQRFATHVFSAVPASGLDRWNGRVLGMPVRRSAAAPGDAAFCRRELGLDPRRLTLLITGASQGAASLNQFVTHFAQRRRDLFAKWQILHLAGGSTDAAARLRAEHQRHGVPAVVLPFLHRMGLAWGAADLALTRAGANSVAEVELNHVPAVFVPYPFHRDLHQKANAQPLVDAGAAAMTLDALDAQANMATLGAALEPLMVDATKRQAMRDALLARSRADAADGMAQFVLDELRRG